MAINPLFFFFFCPFAILLELSKKKSKKNVHHGALLYELNDHHTLSLRVEHVERPSIGFQLGLEHVIYGCRIWICCRLNEDFSLKGHCHQILTDCFNPARKTRRWLQDRMRRIWLMQFRWECTYGVRTCMHNLPSKVTQILTESYCLLIITDTFWKVVIQNNAMI